MRRSESSKGPLLTVTNPSMAAVTFDLESELTENLNLHDTRAKTPQTKLLDTRFL